MMYGDRLKFIREEKEITQYSMSLILDLNKRVYGQYEREYVVMPLKHLNKVCNYLNVSFDYLFELSNTNNYNVDRKELDLKLIGKRLKEFRKSNKLNQVKLANSIGVSKSMISSFERGEYLISTTALYEITDKYKISADYLLGKIDKKPF